jgi:hypothetical protein
MGYFCGGLHCENGVQVGWGSRNIVRYRVLTISSVLYLHQPTRSICCVSGRVNTTEIITSIQTYLYRCLYSVLIGTCRYDVINQMHCIEQCLPLRPSGNGGVRMAHGKVRPITGHQGPRGGGVEVYLYSVSTSALEGGWVVSTTPRPIYPQEIPGTHCTEGWVCPRAGLDVCEKSRPHRDSIPGPSIP